MDGRHRCRHWEAIDDQGEHTACVRAGPQAGQSHRHHGGGGRKNLTGRRGMICYTPKLKALGVSLIPTTAPDHFTTDTPTSILIRQVLGAVAQFEKAALVAKLKAARDRKIVTPPERLTVSAFGKPFGPPQTRHSSRQPWPIRDAHPMRG